MAGPVLGLFLAWAGVAGAGEIVVVAHPTLPVESLSADELRGIYKGEVIFVARMKVHPVTYANRVPVFEGFLGSVVGMTPGQYEGYWIKEVFHSGRVPPRKAVSPADVVGIVATEPGAIGYVPAEALRGVNSVKRVYSVRIP